MSTGAIHNILTDAQLAKILWGWDLPEDGVSQCSDDPIPNVYRQKCANDMVPTENGRVPRV